MSILLSLIGCDAVLFRANFDEEQPAIYYEAAKKTEAPSSLDQLLILNYNIKYGGARLLFFWECDGERYNMTTEEVTTRMDAVAGFISDHDPDIVILQEVDRNSTRSDYMDQTQFLLDRTDMNYGVYASQHQVDYLPSDGMGHVDFGNAILSRWPLSEATRVSLPLVESYPGYYRYLYLKRHVLTTKVDLPWDDNFYAANTHLEAFSEGDTKRQQIEKFHQVLSDLDDQGANWIAAGDLNSLPKGSERLLEFPDDCPGLFDPDDYSEEEEWMDSLFADFNSAMNLDDYAADNEAWFSYTGKPELGWTRTLDYMFTNGVWGDDGASNMVLQDVDQGGFETIHLSDHAPVQAVLEVQ